MRVPFCLECRRPVNWALTAANRKWLPIDPAPDPAGNQAAYRDATGRWMTRQLKDDEEPQGFERRYMPHMGSCPKRQPPPVLPPNVIRITDAPSRRAAQPSTRK